MNDDFIDQFDPPKPLRPEFTAALYQRITQPMKTTTRTRVLRVAALSFAIVAVIATALFFSPSIRAFADSIIQQFKKGNVTIQTTNEAATASQLAGFTVLAPSYLPNGYTIDNQAGVWTVAHQKDGVTADISYEDQATGSHLSIVEQTYPHGESDPVMNRPEKEDVTVRGQQGLWMPAGAKSVLTWEENGITYMIVTSLPKDEVLKVAESLGK